MARLCGIYSTVVQLINLNLGVESTVHSRILRRSFMTIFDQLKYVSCVLTARIFAQDFIEVWRSKRFVKLSRLCVLFSSGENYPRSFDHFEASEIILISYFPLKFAPFLFSRLIWLFRAPQMFAHLRVPCLRIILQMHFCTLVRGQIERPKNKLSSLVESKPFCHEIWRPFPLRYTSF